MEKSILPEESKTLGGLSNEEKPARKETKPKEETKKTKHVSGTGTIDHRSQEKQFKSKTRQINLQPSQQKKGLKSSNIDSGSLINSGSLAKERAGAFSQIFTCIPAACRNFLLELPNLNDDDFAICAVEVFKELQGAKEVIWKVQAAIAYDIYEKNESKKSKGGRGSKGEGIGIIFERECAFLGLSSATMRDYRRIYANFVINPTLDESSPKLRRKMQMDILEDLNLERFFYIRALSAANPLEAIKHAKKRIEETGGQYTEKEFMNEINLSKNSARPARPAPPDTPKPDGEVFSCILSKIYFAYLKRLALKWNKSLAETLEHLLRTHDEMTNPQEVSV